VAQLLELLNIGRSEATGLLRHLVAGLDRHMYAAIRARRREDDASERADILSLLLSARHEDGSRMSDEELRDELLTLVLAGHETTANTLAWAFERLLRTPRAYERLREEARARESDEAGMEYVEASIHEAMRSRPVIPLIGRRVPASASPPGRLSGPLRIPPRAFPRCEAGHLHLDSLRRRYPSVPRRRPRDGRAARSPTSRRAAHRHDCRRPGAGACPPSQRDDDPRLRGARRPAHTNRPSELRGARAHEARAQSKGF